MFRFERTGLSYYTNNFMFYFKTQNGGFSLHFQGIIFGFENPWLNLLGYGYGYGYGYGLLELLEQGRMLINVNDKEGCIWLVCEIVRTLVF